MPKASKELTESRTDEIVEACARLYAIKSFKDITIKDIAAATSFTRTSIYNYFQTKEEIFLALFQREYALWAQTLARLCADNAEMSREDFAQALAHSLEERTTLLKLLSMNLYDMEANSRMERLVEFKRAYGGAIKAVDMCLETFFAEMSKQDRQDFIFAFFPFMFGIYPYTSVTQKQRGAMLQAGVEYVYMSVYEITVREVRRLLNV